MIIDANRKIGNNILKIVFRKIRKKGGIVEKCMRKYRKKNIKLIHKFELFSTRYHCEIMNVFSVQNRRY